CRIARHGAIPAPQRHFYASSVPGTAPTTPFPEPGSTEDPSCAIPRAAGARSYTCAPMSSPDARPPRKKSRPLLRLLRWVVLIGLVLGIAAAIAGALI